jgi:5'-deoxynucleotidase YfbR-like HD superfamily hydrolase
MARKEDQMTIHKVKYLREAADVSRMHTKRIIGEYTVGHHSYNMLAMLRLVWPEAPSSLIWAIIEHDVPERLTGDIPSPAKWAGVVDNNALRDLEVRIIKNTLDGISYYEIVSSHEPLLNNWLKALDILELYMFCLDQLVLGNHGISTMKTRIEKYIDGQIHKFPSALTEIYYMAKADPWETVADLGDVG